mgnify:CR=1 FL=1
MNVQAVKAGCVALCTVGEGVRSPQWQEVRKTLLQRDLFESESSSVFSGRDGDLFSFAKSTIPVPKEDKCI